MEDLSTSKQKLEELLGVHKQTDITYLNKRFSIGFVTIAKITIAIPSLSLQDTLGEITSLCEKIVNETYSGKYCHPYKLEKIYEEIEQDIFIIKEEHFDEMFAKQKRSNPDLTEEEFIKCSEVEYDTRLVKISQRLNREDRVIKTSTVKNKRWTGRYNLIITLSEKNIVKNLPHLSRILYKLENGSG